MLLIFFLEGGGGGGEGAFNIFLSGGWGAFFPSELQR